MPRQHILRLRSGQVQLSRQRLYRRQSSCLCAQVARAWTSLCFALRTATVRGKSHYLPCNGLGVQSVRPNHRKHKRCAVGAYKS
jgi:hypothetical protein